MHMVSNYFEDASFVSFLAQVISKIIIAVGKKKMCKEVPEKNPNLFSELFSKRKK